MRIHKDFTGGNIHVVSVDNHDIYLENELRDTVGDWFYWAFCVEGAQGQKLTFHFQQNRLGYWGPAISHDLVHWHWLEACEGDSFTYEFSQEEEKVYFAHHMLYHPERLDALAQKHGWRMETLCRSRRGREVPCLTLGEGERTILMTARHHACESTGNYVLEGVLEEMSESLPERCRIFCVPFVDYDGVVDGDQGKNRAPYDHNRDYGEVPIYPEVAAIGEYVKMNGCHYGFDFHSPWHRGGENDHIYVVRNRADKDELYNTFAVLLEEEITEDAMTYRSENDHPANTGWNQPSPNCAFTMNSREDCVLAFTLENTYFGTVDNKVSQEKLIALGRCFARAARRFVDGR